MNGSRMFLRGPVRRWLQEPRWEMAVAWMRVLVTNETEEDRHERHSGTIDKTLGRMHIVHLGIRMQVSALCKTRARHHVFIKQWWPVTMWVGHSWHWESYSELGDHPVYGWWLGLCNRVSFFGRWQSSSKGEKIFFAKVLWYKWEAN